jgi:UDP-glucose 4-epimerase
VNLLITGGLGNLGLWLTHHFLENGHNVTVLGRSEKVVINHSNYIFLACDITNRDNLSQVIEQYYDYCIHAASYNEHFHSDYSEKALSINALGTDNLCESLLNYGVGKFIYLSTFHVYGCSSGNVTEETEVSPLNDYGLTHFFAEKYIEKHQKVNGLKYCVLRLTNSYGCPKDPNTDKWYLILNDLCNSAYIKNKIVLNSNGGIQKDFIWMGDVVSTIEAVMDESRCSNTYFNLSTGKSISVFDLAIIVQQAYKDSYHNELPIEINADDKTRYHKLSVANNKLLNILNIKFNNNILSEAHKIFKLLDDKQ